MSAEYFDEQRRQLIAAIRAHTEQVATQIGKTALDKRVLRTMTKVPRHDPDQTDRDGVRSAFGTKRTWQSRSSMSAFGGKADMANL
jgi:hypothetical protein